MEIESSTSDYYPHHPTRSLIMTTYTLTSGPSTPPESWDDWLGDAAADMDDDQRDRFDRLANGIAERVADSGDRAEMLSGLHQAITGSATVATLARDWLAARIAEREAMRRLHGAMVAADDAGVPQTRIAEDAGVARDTVRRALGLL